MSDLECTRARVLANARTIYGPSRSLDIITYGCISSQQISAAIVEYNATSRSFIHCCSAAEETRIAALEHLLVITEDILQRLIDKEGISSQGWLPATQQAQHAATFGTSTTVSRNNSVAFGNGSAFSERSTSHDGKVGNGNGNACLPGSTQAQSALPPTATFGSMPNLRFDGFSVASASPADQRAPQPRRQERVKWIVGSEG